MARHACTNPRGVVGLVRIGAHSLFDVKLDDANADANLTGRTRTRTRSTLCMRNVLPAPFLKARFASTHTTVLFLATLTRSKFYGDTLGLPEDTAWLDVAAPFRAE